VVGQAAHKVSGRLPNRLRRQCGTPLSFKPIIHEIIIETTRWRLYEAESIVGSKAESIPQGSNGISRLDRFSRFRATVCKTVCPMLSDRCPVLSVMSVCDVGVLWPNGWMDQDVAWYGGRHRPRPHCVRWAHSSLPPKKGAPQPPPLFYPCLLWPRGWMNQDALGTEVGLGPGDVVLDGDPAPSTEGSTAAPTHFSAHFALARPPISAAAEHLLHSSRS